MAGHRTAAFCETSPKVPIPVPAWFRLTVPLAENTSSGWQSGSCILNRTWLYQDLFPFFFVLHVLLWRMRWREVFPQWQFKPGLFCDVIPLFGSPADPNHIQFQRICCSLPLDYPFTPDFQLSQDGNRFSPVSISAAFWAVAVRMCHSCCSWRSHCQVPGGLG